MTSLKPWRVTGQRYVIEGKHLTVRADTCDLGNGRTIDEYHVLEYHDWVNVIALTDEGNVVLIREYRHGARAITIGLPSGSADPDENADQAAARELLEETGYACDQLVCVGTAYANWASHNNQVRHYLGFGAKKVGEQKLDPNEEIEVFEMPYAEFVEYDGNGPQHCLHAANLFYAERYFGMHPELRPKN